MTERSDLSDPVPRFHRRLVVASRFACLLAGAGACSASGSAGDTDHPDGGSPATDAERCTGAEGTWSETDHDCTLPRPDLPAFWADFETAFRLRFPANVTGSDINPYLTLYVEPQPDVVVTCDSWRVKMGYAQQLDPQHSYLLKSSDCRFQMVASTCMATHQRLITFHVDGWGEGMAPSGGPLLRYKISDWDKLHGLIAVDLPGCP